MKNKLLTLLTLHLGLAAVVAQPVITNQPQNQTNIAGTTVMFAVGATGAPQLSYQWRSHANPISYTNIPFGTEATLVLTNVQPTQRRFAVVVTDAGGLSATSSPLVSLTVVTPPSITPLNPTASLFADVTLYATNGSGAARSSYQWLLNGEPIAGAVTNRLVVTNVQPTNVGDYAFVVTYAFGSVTSQVAMLTITPFTITPASPTASLFADVTLLFTNSSGPPLSYQWLFNGAPIAGAVTNKLVVTNVQKINAGDYATVVTYAFGSVTSQVATLKITPFNSIYCFGFSWTDTGGNGCNWPGPRYFQNRACNGSMWPELVSTNLGLAYDKSNNYAFCGALSADELRQVTVSYRVPRRPDLSLHCIWEAGSDFAHFVPPNGLGTGFIDVTNVAACNQLIQDALLNNSNAVYRLYEKGARAILWQNQGGTNISDIVNVGGYRAGLIDGYIRQLNTNLLVAMDDFSRTHADVRIYFADFYTLWHEIDANPQAFGFTEIVLDVLGDTNLLDKSFTGPGADYLWWDFSHPTTKFHQLLAAKHMEALRNSILERIEIAVTHENVLINLKHLLIGRDYTLQTSSDLTSWDDVQTFTASAGTNGWTGVLDRATSVFYRLQWQP